jgi:hypothetical protein
VLGLSDNGKALTQGRLIGEKEAAAALGVSVRVLRNDRIRRDKGIPFLRYGEGRRCVIRYDADDLNRYRDESRVA